MINIKNRKGNTLVTIIIILLLILILCMLLMFVFQSDDSSNTLLNNSSSSNSDSSEIIITRYSTEIEASFSNEELVENYTNYTAKINLDDLSSNGSGVEISNGTITISKDGVYYFSGTAEDSNIIVNAPEALVVIVLDNANIISKNTAVITGVEADEIIINVKEGSKNMLIDESTYSVFIEDDEPNATVFSKTDLTINGTGTLVVNANYEDGIVSKDDLKIIDATIEVNAKDDGIRGKDSLIIKDANFEIYSEGDGLKSTNDEEKGYIYIDGGVYNITSQGDGIDAENIVNINGDAIINITTTGDVDDKTKSSSEFEFNGKRNYADDLSLNDESSSASSKGIKAGSEITINSGKISIASTDDAIHSNGFIIINSIDAELSTGDDGIHADQSLVINDGEINITKSYEGIEAQYIEINDGKIDLISSDDGINVNGGTEEMFMKYEGQENSDDSNRLLIINGGTINVNANGDGLDSNGSIKITGGTIVVAGSTNSGNGTLDYNYACTVTGGSLVYYGTTGMWQDPGNSSTVSTITFGVSNGNVGDKIVLKDSSGNTIASLTADKTYQKIGFTDNSIKEGETYTIYINGEEAGSVESSSRVSSNSQSSGTQNLNMDGNGMQKNREMR